MHGMSKVRDAVAAAVVALRSHKVKHARFFAPVGLEHEHGWADIAAGEIAKAVALADWRFDRHLSKDRPTRLDTATLTLPLAVNNLDSERATDVSAEARVRRGLALADGTNLARALANSRSDDCTPAFMEDVARTLAAENGFGFECLKGNALVEEGLRMIAAVGQGHKGDEYEPRLVVLECNVSNGLKATSGSSSDGDGGGGTLLLVGKGVTFDTGGLNLKPTGSIEGMHLDMGGAAAVLGAAHTVGRLLAHTDSDVVSRCASPPPPHTHTHTHTHTSCFETHSE
jgi:leucyl aminopeptidase